MPYSYYGYGDFLANNIYVILLIPVLLLSVWAQAQVSGSFRRYSRVANRRHLTGAQAAEAVLRSHGIYDLPVRSCRGNLTDHYDAVQYAVGYGPIKVRSAIIPVTQFGSRFSFVLLLIGLLLYSQPLFLVGILLFSLTTVFQLVTLPVEFNASHRALETIEGQGLLDGEELDGAKKVLRAAAMTYVAALLMSALQLLRYVLIFLGRDRRGGRD